MLIGVVSDTHGQTDYTLEALNMLDALEVDVVLHCGDVGSADVVKLFYGRPTHFVLGNVDHEPTIRRACLDAGLSYHERFAAVELGGSKIAVAHGDDLKILNTAIESGEYDLVCTGHTHVPKQERRGKTLVLNPGALYRATPHTLAIVRLPEVEAEILRV